MTSHRSERRGWSLGSARLRAALSLGVVLSLASTGTFAFWTDSATVAGATLTGGTINLELKDGANPFVDSVSDHAALDIDAMVPGNTVAAVLTVRNSGTAPLTFVASSAATNPDTKNLAGALVVKVTAASAVTGSSPTARTCAGTALTGSGTVLNSALVGTAIELAAASTTTVCVQIGLPNGASTSLQGATTDVTLTFTGTQKVT